MAEGNNFDDFADEFESGDERGGNEFDFVGSSNGSPQAASMTTPPEDDQFYGDEQPAAPDASDAADPFFDGSAADQAPRQDEIKSSSEASSPSAVAAAAAAASSGSPSSSEATSFDFSAEVAENPDGPLARWQAERNKVLAQREAAAVKSKQELLEKAKRDSDGYYANREERIARIKRENREKEANEKAELEHTFSHGTVWQKVGKMVDLKPGAGANEGDGKARMARLLLQLQNDKN